MQCCFPASGLRAREDGRLLKLGLDGNGWASSACGSTDFQGAKLGFVANSILPLDYTSRAYCYPVRCVQAFIFICIASIESGVLQPVVCSRVIL